MTSHNVYYGLFNILGDIVLVLFAPENDYAPQIIGVIEAREA